MNLRSAEILVFGLVLGVSSSLAAFEINFGALEDLTRKIIALNEDVTEEKEIEIGGNLASGLLGAAPLVDNPALQQYVNDVGLWVASHSSRKELPWAFGVIDSDGINAFAAPGGYVIITLGLYRLLEDEAELAGVLAHEISHVVEKHHLNALQDRLKAEIWTGLAVLAVDDAENQATARKIVNAGVQIYSSGLDQELEFDADLRGVVLAARAGYDPFALLDVLNILDSINPQAEEMLVMTKTHPPTGARLATLAENMDGRMDRYADGQTNPERFRRASVSQ